MSDVRQHRHRSARRAGRDANGPKFPCPSCGGFRSKVISGEAIEDKYKRRRECCKCGQRFNTSERVEDAPTA